MTQLQLKILMALPQLDERDAGVTQLSQLLGASKSAVSRACDELEKEGSLAKCGRTLALTGHGHKGAKAFCETRDGLMTGLENNGVAAAWAAADSLAIMQHCSDETLSLAAQYSRRMRFIRLLQEQPRLGMEEYVADFGVGHVPLAFALYKADKPSGHVLSMANEAFFHPGLLCVEAGGAVIRLRTRPVAHPSGFHQLVMRAGLGHMRYQNGKQFSNCLAEGDNVVFPASCLALSCVPQAGLLMGDVMLKVKPDIDEKHMPERTVLFTAYL